MFHTILIINLHDIYLRVKTMLNHTGILLVYIVVNPLRPCVHATGVFKFNAVETMAAIVPAPYNVL